MKNHSLKNLVTRPLLLLSLAISLFSASALAGTAELEALLNQATRPTMIDVIKATDGKIPEENPFAAYLKVDGRYKAQQQELAGLAKVIPFMEKMFPEAIWAPLGRDAVIFGDMLDAFYLAIGQRDRVSRLNASGASFGQDMNIRVKFLESAGLNLKDVKNSRPFVGLDRTSYNHNSQSTVLIRAAYDAYGKAGGNKADLIHHLNFLGLSAQVPGTGLNQALIDNYFKTATISSPYPGHAAYPPSLSNIIQLPIGNWTDSLPWHNTFGALVFNPQNGRTEGTPGVLSHIDHRKAIIAHMLEILQQVGKPEFIAAVQLEAKAAYGFEFPIKNEALLKKIADYETALKIAAEEKAKAEKLAAEERARAEKLAAEEAKRAAEKAAETYGEDMHARLAKAAEGLPALPADEQKGYLSTNAQTLSNLLANELAGQEKLKKLAPEAMAKYSNNLVTLETINMATVLRSKNLLSSKDYRRLLARALSASDVNEEFLKGMSRIYEAEPLMRETLQEKALFFLTTFKTHKRKGTENTETVFRKIRELVMKLPGDCADVFAAEEKRIADEAKAEADAKAAADAKAKVQNSPWWDRH